jgi:DNA-binding transcriptional LysR family regulator
MMDDSVHDISIRHLQYALAVAEAGSVTQAAERLNIAQPSLSQQILKLEQRLDTRLFERMHAGLVETAAGAKFLDKVSVLLTEFEDAVRELDGADQHWTFGISPGIDTSLVAQVEHQLNLYSSKANIELIAQPSSALIEGLLHGKLDLAFIRPPFSADGLVSHVVATNPLGVVMAHNHPLARKPSIAWDDMARYRLLWFDADRAPGFAHHTIEWIGQHGWNPELVRGTDRYTLFEHQLLHDHTLVALRPAYTVQTSSTLVWRPFAHEPPIERIAVAAVTETRGATLIGYITKHEHQ